MHGTYPKTTPINSHTYLCVFRGHFVGIPQSLTQLLPIISLTRPPRAWVARLDREAAAEERQAIAEHNMEVQNGRTYVLVARDQKND